MMPAVRGFEHNQKGKWLLGLALLIESSFAGLRLASWPLRLRYPGEGDFVEGIHLAEMLHLREGVPVYAPASSQSFDGMIYGPLYYLLGARLINPEKPAYQPLRVLSALATLGSAAGCALLAYWLSRSLLAAALAALILLTYGFVTQYANSSRADTGAVLLFFLGFLVAYRFRDRRALLFSVPLMLLGFYYKSQALAGPLAVMLFLLMEKRYRLAAEFAAWLAAGGAGLALIFQFIIFRGQAFLLHLVTYNLLPWSWGSFLTGLKFLGVVLSIPIILGIEHLRSYPDKLLGCYLGFACLIALLTSGRTGSDSNYFLECVLVPVVLAAVLVARRITQPEMLVLLVLALLTGQFYTLNAARPQDSARDRAIQEFLHQNFSPHTPAIGFFAGDLIRAGLQAPIPDLYLYAQLVRKGVLSDQGLQADIDRRRFGLVVTSLDLRNQKVSVPPEYYFSEPVRRAILQNYRLAGALDLPSPERHRDDYRFYAWVPQ